MSRRLITLTAIAAAFFVLILTIVLPSLAG